MNCPVCPRTDLPADARICPNCGTDLGPLRRATELGDSYLNEALRLLEQDKLEEAAQRLACVVSLEPGRAHARVLLGKVLWKQGRREEAAHQWRTASQLEPENTTIQQLLATARAETQPSQLGRRIPSRLWIAALAVVLALISLTLIVVSRKLSAAREEIKSYREQLAAAKAQAGGETPADPEQISKLVESLEGVGGVEAKQEAGAAVLRFSQGFFPAGSATLKREARELLGRVAVKARQLGAPLTITVEGHTNNTPVRRRMQWKSNWALGLSRAQAAAVYLQSQLAIDRVRIEVRSAGDERPPFPNDTPENRRRNCTVTLHLRPAGTKLSL